MVPENEAAPAEVTVTPAEPKLDAAVEVTVEQVVQLPADTEFSDDVNQVKKPVYGVAVDPDAPSLDGGKCPKGPWVDVTKDVEDGEYVAEEGDEDAYGEMFDEAGPITYADFGLMTEDELAFAFDLTKNTMAKWRKNEDVDGQSGPAFCRIGKTIYYRLDDVDTWIETNIEHPPAHAPVTTAVPVA